MIVHHFAYEFGLETTSVETKDGRPLVFCEEVYDFGSGCICCSPKGDFARLLWRLKDLSEERVAAGRGRVTHLLVETTGEALRAIILRTATDLSI